MQLKVENKKNAFLYLDKQLNLLSNITKICCSGSLCFRWLSKLLILLDLALARIIFGSCLQWTFVSHLSQDHTEYHPIIVILNFNKFCIHKIWDSLTKVDRMMY